MTDQNAPQRTGDEQANDKREQRMMWIFSGAIVLVILLAMGANMMFHKDQAANPENTDISAQSRSSPGQ